MISISEISKDEPYKKFVKFYKKALKNNQNLIEAILIASYDSNKNEVDARFVNLKYIINDEWFFFTNYNSVKANQFKSHNQIAAVFHWDSIGVQVRLKSKIMKASEKFSNTHFEKRSKYKNALAISSSQSSITSSYDKVIEDYKNVLTNEEALSKIPEYWGGYSFKPYYFEFWEGDDYRINRREAFELKNNKWFSKFLQP